MFYGYAKVAGLNVKVACDFEFKDLEFPFPDEVIPDITIKITQNDIEKYRKLTGVKTSKFTCAWMTTLGKISDSLFNYNGLLFHAATFDVNGQGIAFSAKSGTGKTTHMLNWQKLYSDRMTIVNGDKPIIRFLNDDFSTAYAYGTPWSGKERLWNDTCTPLKHICFIERSETNYVTPIDKSEAVSRIMKQIYMPQDPVALANTLSLIDKLLSCCKVWVIHCNMEEDSARVAYETIFKK